MNATLQTRQQLAPLSTRDVEQLKIEHRYQLAGQLACVLGLDRNYGCHYGMKSQRTLALAGFHAGYDEIEAVFAAQARETAKPKRKSFTTSYVARLDGEIVGTRTTKSRTYTHAVITQDVEEKARDYAYNYVATDGDRRNFHYNAAIVREDVNHEHVRVCAWRAQPDFQRIREAHEAVAGGFNAYVARLRDEQIRRFEEKLAKGGFKPGVACWCGRRALAEKEAAARSSEWRRVVAIVEAEKVD